MAIQWFPGHMHRARKQIAEAIPNIDLVIEVLDARLPFSSENPLVEKLRLDRPCLKLLNKADLADPAMTKRWLDYFNSQKNVRAIELIGLDSKQVRHITQFCHDMLPARQDSGKLIRTMIMGIPNVGKSTLINTLAGKVIAKTGNTPALTRHQQQIKLNNGIVLSDTPGILWPKIHNVASGLRLAASGAVRDTAIDYQEVAEFALQHLLTEYADLIQTRYKLKTFPTTAHEALSEIGKRRGFLRSGGIVDMHKAAEIFIHELRAGTLGRITFETPEMMLAEKAALRAAEDLELKEGEGDEEVTQP